MSAFRYLVLDATGLVINTILVDDPYPSSYWPGYGSYITCAFGEPDPTPPADLDIIKGSTPFSYLTVRPISRCEIGDTMDTTTGGVTPAPIPEPALEEPAL